jgi:DNA-binding GntR family transcriptional regulator
MPATSKVDNIVDAIRNRILAREFGEEGRLPSFRTLATEYHTTQETMNKTIQALQAEGLIISKGAKGIFTNLSRIRMPAFTPNINDFLKKYVQDPIQKYIEPASVITASDNIAKAMKLPKRTKVLRRYKMLGAGDKVFRIEETFYPKKILTDEIINKTTEDANFMPLALIKKATGYYFKYYNEEIIVRLPTTDEQRLLQIVRTNPVIDIKRRTYTPDKKTVIFYSHFILDANHFLLAYDYELAHWE